MLVCLATALLVVGGERRLSSRPSGPDQVIKPARPLPAFATLQAWIQLAKTHTVGRMDDAVRIVAEWPAAQIREIDHQLLALQAVLDPAGNGPSPSAGPVLTVKDLPALYDVTDDLFRAADGRVMDAPSIRKPDSAPRVAIARIMLRAGMLMTDLLTAGSREDLVTRLPASGDGGSTFRVSDTLRRGVADLDAYWSCARRAIDLVEPTPVSRGVGRDWYVVTGGYLLSQRDYAAGVAHLEHANQVIAGEPRLALYLGAAYENLAAPSVQAAFPNGEAALAVGGRSVLLQRAEFQQRSALLLDSDLADASLRLGRVLLLMARPDEALPFLERAEAALTRRESRYFAALFAGLAEGLRGNLTAARIALARAAAAFPQAQSPRLALAQLLMIEAKHDEALASLQDAVRSDPSADPWWTYGIDLTWDIGHRLDALRASIGDRLR